MPLRYAAPAMPPLPNVALPPNKRVAQQGGSGGGGNVGGLIKMLAGGQGQGSQDQLAQALSAARSGSGPTVGSYLPPDYANAIPDDVLPEDLGMTDAQFADAIRSSQVADALQGFNWSAGV